MRVIGQPQQLSPKPSYSSPSVVYPKIKPKKSQVKVRNYNQKD